MHPLAHILTGALIGQVAPTPAASFLGGVASHFLLDVIPHAEGDTFRQDPKAGPGVELIEAAVELAVGVGAVAWLAGQCTSARVLSLGLGILGGLLPDLIDFPLDTFWGVTILHRRRWHWTVQRRHAALGILTQVVMIGVAAGGLWLTAGCGR